MLRIRTTVKHFCYLPPPCGERKEKMRFQIKFENGIMIREVPNLLRKDYCMDYKKGECDCTNCTEGWAINLCEYCQYHYECYDDCSNKLEGCSLDDDIDVHETYPREGWGSVEAPRGCRFERIK